MQSGFGNHFSTEALPNTLPHGQNSPQRAPRGLYAEQLTGTAFTAPRHTNQRSWLYRIQPSVTHGLFERSPAGSVGKHWSTPPLSPEARVALASPNPMRWDPIAMPSQPTDFIEGVTTVLVAGDALTLRGLGVHLYAANRSMKDRFFYNADGELLIVPQEGSLLIKTELGVMSVDPGEIACVPRGVKFYVELPDSKPVRGYIAENFGAAFRLPDLGPIGANGLANPRDFLSPVAAFEERKGSFEIVTKAQGTFWSSAVDHSPLDVVAWHGNYAPYKYDLRLFNTIGSTSFDHPDPSILTVLTSASEIPGVANCDFVVFGDRWLVQENTFRPPYFHRNCMSEFMGNIYGTYDAKERGFVPGGGSLHNCMSAHGPETAVFKKASEADLKPQHLKGSLAFMFETRYPYLPTEFALKSPSLQRDYIDNWKGLGPQFSRS